MSLKPAVHIWKIRMILPVIMVCDDAYVEVEGKKTSLVRGKAYLLRKDQDKERLEDGRLINL